MEQVHGFYPAGDVKECCRFVQQDQRTFLNQGLGNHGLLTFSVRQFGGVGLCLVGNSYGLQCMSDYFVIAGVQSSEKARVRLSSEGYQLIDGQPAGLSLVGQYHSDGARTFPFGIGCDGTSQQFEGTFQGHLCGGQCAQQS